MEADVGAGPGLDLSSFLPMIVVSLAVFAYIATCLMIIARKSGTANGWLAWIPLGNLFLMLAIGRKSGWWFLLFLVPLVNLVVFVVVWMAIARVRGKPPWTAVLLLVPFVNLAVPAYFASGPAMAPGAASGTAPAAGPQPKRATASTRAPARPTTCPSCSAALQPGDAFCQECGTAIAAASGSAPADAGAIVCPTCGMAAVAGDTFCGECGGSLATAEAAPIYKEAAPAQWPAKKGAPVGLIAGVAVLMLVLGAAAWVFFGAGGYQAPQRRTPALPPRLAGTLAEFPVDSDPTRPAQPTSFSTQTLGKGASFLPPANSLPPGVNPGALAAGATAVSTAIYRGGPADPAVNVHVMDVPPDRNAALKTAGQVQQATGGQTTGVRVQSPKGQTYTGYSIRTVELLIYVLLNHLANKVIVVYAPEPAAFPVAERLAANVGNGQGLTDYPAVRNTFGVLPAALPAGLTLAEARNFTPQDLKVDFSELDKIASQSSNAEVQQFVSRVRMLIPQSLTMARYEDPSGNDWNTLVGYYGSPNRGRQVWWLVRYTVGLAMKSTTVSGSGGLFVDDAESHLLMFQKGPYLSVIGTPRSASMEQLWTFARAMQL